MILIEYVDTRMRWRGFAADWALAAGLTAGALLLGALIANMTGGSSPLAVIGPQILFVIALHPALIWLIALLDRLRLIPIRELDR